MAGVIGAALIGVADTGAGIAVGIAGGTTLMLEPLLVAARRLALGGRLTQTFTITATRPARQSCMTAVKIDAPLKSPFPKGTAD